MIRKRTIIIVITILLLLAGILFYLQWGRQMDVSSSSGSGSDNHYELRVSVILNTLVVTDQQKYTKRIFGLHPKSFLTKKLKYVLSSNEAPNSSTSAYTDPANDPEHFSFLHNP